MALEQLECRALFAATTGDVPTPPVSMDAGSVLVDSGPTTTDTPVTETDPMVFQTAVMTTAPDPTPWFTYAQQSQLGTMVLRVSLTQASSPTADPNSTVQVLQVTFNAAKPSASVPAAGAPTVPAGTDPAAPPASEPKFTGVVFPGQGVPVLPTDTWPKPLDSFDTSKPPAVTTPQEYFLVIQTDSDAMLGIATFIVSLASDPSVTQPGSSGTGSDAGGSGGTGGGLPGFGSLFGPSAGGATTGTGTDTPTGGSGDTAPGFGALLAFAALAGLGNAGTGPSVTLTNDTGQSSTDLVTSDPRLDITANPGARLQYSVDGGRHWRPSFRAREGENTLQVRSIDSSGTASAATSFSFTFDRRRPAAPQASLDGAGRGRPAVVSDTPTITLKNREAGATVQYSINRGEWTSSLASVPGRNVVRIRQVDLAGNVSRPSKPVVFTVRATSVPAAGLVVSPTGTRTKVHATHAVFASAAAGFLRTGTETAFRPRRTSAAFGPGMSACAAPLPAPT